MSGNSGILSPAKSPNRQGSLEEGEDAISTRAKELSESKNASKCVRVLTVLAYILSVSMAAILLSLYYVFLWKPVASEPEKGPETPMAYMDQIEITKPRSGPVDKIIFTASPPVDTSTYNILPDHNIFNKTFNLNLNDTELPTSTTIQETTPPSPSPDDNLELSNKNDTNDKNDNEKQPNNT